MFKICHLDIWPTNRSWALRRGPCLTSCRQVELLIASPTTHPHLFSHHVRWECIPRQQTSKELEVNQHSIACGVTLVHKDSSLMVARRTRTIITTVAVTMATVALVNRSSRKRLVHLILFLWTLGYFRYTMIVQLVKQYSSCK